MDNLNRLHHLLSTIKENADSIINLNAVVLNKILLEGQSIYDDFREKSSNNDLSDDEIDEFFYKAMTEYIGDARKIKQEINSFVEFILSECKPSVESFLYQVWTGDVYDGNKTDALILLNDDLEKQLSSLTLENIFNLALTLSAHK